MVLQNDKPLVSIITPTLNSKRFIRDNIESIRSQTYPRIEHIIIDGASSDDTLSIVQACEPTAIIFSEPDKGISDAFNKGLRVAKGDIIAILNSDDYYAHAEIVQRMVNLFFTHREAKLIYGKVHCVDAETGELLVIYGEPFSAQRMRKQIITPHPAIFARREVYESVGPFSLAYKVAMDHEYFLKASCRYEPFFFDEVVAVMRWGGFSVKNIFRAHREVYRLLRDNGVKKTAATLNLLQGYAMTSLSLALQKAGLRKFVLSYRRRKGWL